MQPASQKEHGIRMSSHIPLGLGYTYSPEEKSREQDLGDLQLLQKTSKITHKKCLFPNCKPPPNVSELFEGEVADA